MAPTMTTATPPPAAPTPAPAAIPAKPPYPPDDFIRYGKILAPNTDAGHPFKLAMPYPGFAELQVPDQGQFAMRAKLENLAKLSDSQIWDQLRQWPAFGKMSLGDQGMMLARIQMFRDRREKVAAAAAHHLGLVTLTPAQKAKFEQEYWDRRLQLDQQLSKQFEPAVKAAELKLDQDLFREFSTPGKTMVQVTPRPVTAGAPSITPPPNAVR